MFQSVQLLDKFQRVNAQQWNSKEKVQKLLKYYFQCGLELILIKYFLDFSILLIKEKKKKLAMSEHILSKNSTQNITLKGNANQQLRV